MERRGFGYVPPEDLGEGVLCKVTQSAGVDYTQL